jgi:hypothetical protein
MESLVNVDLLDSVEKQKQLLFSSIQEEYMGNYGKH